MGVETYGGVCPSLVLAFGVLTDLMQHRWLLSGPYERWLRRSTKLVACLDRVVHTSRGVGGVLMILRAIVIRPLASHPYKAWTEHAGFSPNQARNQSPSAKRRDAFDELHKE
ncbi:unnamed protein product [Sphacelaria rigidula]